MLLTARYVLPVAAPHIENGAVLVRDDKIVEIGDLEHLKAAHPDEEVRDYGLAALLPGFIDTHTHLEYTVMRGLVDDLPYSQWKLQLLQKEERLTGEDWCDSALMGALEAARSGITTVADITKRGCSADAAKQGGLRAFVYREVSTYDAKRIDAVMAAASRGHREVARRGRPDSIVRSASRPTARTPVTPSCSAPSPTTLPTGPRCRCTSRAARKSTTS